MKKLNTFESYTKIALLSNILFVFFIIFTLLYYSYYLRTGNTNAVVEFIAYTIECSGFIVLLTATVGYVVNLRFRMPLKIAMIIYFLTEFSIMILDFNVIDAEEFYTPASKVLIISHCIFSSVVALLYMYLDPEKKCLQISCGIASVIMMLASFSIVFRVRVYASVLVNSIAYIFLFASILFFTKKEMIYADFHDDQAKVYEDDSSTIFENDVIEKKKK